MEVKGVWFDGVTSAMKPAHLQVFDDGRVELTVQGCAVKSLFFESLTISPRLGKTPRYIYPQSGGKFETTDNEQIDIWVKQHRGSAWDTWVHRWESQWHMVAASVAMVVFFAWAVMVYGLPAASQKIAFWLPEEVPRVLGEHTLKTLDDTLFKTSTLTEPEQRRVLRHFQPVLEQYPELPLKVLFRDGGAIGPNAFALPDGSLVFTDQMVAMSRNDDELLAVLAHEIGHVAERHSLQALVRTSMLGFLLMAVTGDVSASSDIFLAVPLLMTELSHSRKFERQADDFALRYLRNNNIAPSHFIHIMSRLEGAGVCMKRGRGSQGDNQGDNAKDAAPDIEEPIASAQSGSSGEVDESANHEASVAVSVRDIPADKFDRLQCFRSLSDTDANHADDETEANDDTWMGYLSSHPSTAERLEKFRE